MNQNIKFRLAFIYSLILIGISSVIISVTIISISLLNIYKDLPEISETLSVFDDDNYQISTNTISQIENYQNLSEKLVSTSEIFETISAFAPSFGGIAVINQEIFALKLESKRISRDLQTAILLTESSIYIRNLLIDFSNPLNQLSNNRTLEITPEFSTTKESLHLSIDIMNTQIELSEKHSSVFSPLTLLNLNSKLKTNEEKIINTSLLVLNLSNMLDEYNKMVQLSSPLNSILQKYDTSNNLTNDDLSNSFIQLKTSASSLKIKTNGLLDYVKTNRIYNQKPIIEVLTLLLIVFESIEYISISAEPLISSLNLNSETTIQDTQIENDLPEILDNLHSKRETFIENTNRLQDIANKIKVFKKNVNDPNLEMKINELENILLDFKSGIELISAILPITKNLFEENEITRYLILGHSSDELRATGGFVSSIWVVTFANNTLLETRYYDTVRVDNWNKLDLYPKPPNGLAKHMNAHVWLLRDVAWEPDFPTTANIAIDMFKIGQTIEVDGVISINQWALMKLIESTGEIKSPEGDNISELNLLAKLEDGTDKYGRAYTDWILNEFVNKMFKSKSLDAKFLFSASKNLKASLDEKELIIFSTSPEIQNILSTHGWDGKMESTNGDYLFTVDSNVGWSKSDRNIERKTIYNIDLSKEKPRANLTISYNNHSGTGSLPCNPQWMKRGTNYNEFKNACYWNYWRIYTPINSSILYHTPLPLPSYSVAAEIGAQSINSDSFEIKTQYGYNVFSGLSWIEGSESKKINLIYELPNEILNKSDNTIEYSLLIQKQSGVRDRKVKVNITLPIGYKLKSTNNTPTNDNSKNLEFEFELDRDTSLKVVFEKVE